MTSRYALITFLWSRVAIWLAALFAFLVIIDGNPNAIRRDDPFVIHDVGSVIDVWARWDAYSFVRIAHHGYGMKQGDPAFYPLYPGLNAVVGRAAFGHYVLGGVVVSLLACLGSFLLLGRLANQLCGPVVARRSILLLAVWPMSLFLQAVYSESAFLLVALAAFLTAERRRYWLAGLLTWLSVLARPTGLAVAVGILLIVLRERRLGPIAKFAASLPILAIFPLILHLDGRNAFSFARVESIWYRQRAPFGPVGGLWDAGKVAWQSIRQLFGHPSHPYWVSGANHFAAVNLESTVFFLIYVVLGVVAWRRLGAPYGAMALMTILIPLALPTRDVPLLSMPRFGLVAFPCFVALATMCARPNVERAVVATSAIFLGLATVQWALWQWVS